MNQDGVTVTSQSDILLAFKDYYSKLWTAPASHDIDIIELIPDDIPTLSDIDNSVLTLEVSKEEVYLTIVNLPTGKTSGLNGFNIEIYRAF